MKRLALMFAAATTMLLLNGLVFAQDTTLTITSSGNVGIGTTNPTEKVQSGNFNQPGPVYLKLATNGVNQPPTGLKFSGIKLRHFNDNYGFTLESIDESGSSAGWFQIKSHFDDSAGTTRLAIHRATGNVGIGTTAPDQKLSVNGNASKVGGGTWATFSDRRVKQDINVFTDGLSTLKGIRPVTFRYNGKLGYPTDKTYVGVIAQDIQSVAPYTVDTYRAKLDTDDAEETDVLRFDASALTYIAINAIKELDAKVEELRELQEENRNLSNRLAELEALVKSLAVERTSVDGKSLGELR
jgi:hypothetical protein